jgi:hypothetical protein
MFPPCAPACAAPPGTARSSICCFATFPRTKRHGTSSPSAPNGVAWGRHLRSVQHATDTAYPLRAFDPTESILPRDVVALTLAHRILAP